MRPAKIRDQDLQLVSYLLDEEGWMYTELGWYLETFDFLNLKVDLRYLKWNGPGGNTCAMSGTQVWHTLQQVLCYLALDFNGEWCVGKVAKCLNLKMSETVASRVTKRVRFSGNAGSGQSFWPWEEKKIQVTRPFMPPPLRCWTGAFLIWWERDKGCHCLSAKFALSHTSCSWHYSIGILHIDLKPDNIMFVNHKDQSFRVRLIDFGLALLVSKVKVGMNKQPCV